MSHISRAVRAFLLAVAPLFLAVSAHASANANGTLIVHVNTGLVYCSDNTTYCGSAGLVACDQATTSVNGPGIAVFFVIASFQPDSSPRLTGVTFGIDYPSSLTLVGHGACGDFELADGGWPASGNGTAVTFNTAQTSHLTTVYWFAGYNYGSPVPALFSVTPHPTQGGEFADDSTPAQLDAIAGYGALGFDQAGIDACVPTGGDGFGACCFSDHTCVPNFRADDCVAQGGVYAGDFTLCSGDPCGFELNGACCLPTQDCQLMSEFDCNAAGGTFFPNYGNCPPTLCHQPGACCYPNGECAQWYPDYCATISGAIFMGEGVPCDPNPCVPEGGACCYPWGVCGFTTQENCDANQGIFLGAGTDCEPDPCIHQLLVACCLPDGSCQQMTQEACTDHGGGFFGAETECSPTACDGLQFGACCMSGNTCFLTTEAYCYDQFGTYWGDGSRCAPDPCNPPLGACCYPDGSCAMMLEFNCAGDWMGGGVDCASDPCVPVPIERSSWGRIKSRYR